MRRNASSWSAGRVPRPSPLVNTGTRRCSTAGGQLRPRRRPSRRRCRRRTPGARRRRPARPAGRSASGSGSTPRPAAGSTAGTSPADGPNTSSGKSRNTGPRCGSAASAIASWTIAPAFVGVEDGGRRLRDRRQDRHVVELLQRPGAPAQLRGPSAEHDQRRPVEPRRRDRRDAVGDARAGGERGDGRAPGQLGVGLGGERRRLLVAGVDDAHALVAGRLVQRPDVPAVEREHHVDPEGPHRRDRLLAGVALDPLRSCAHRAPFDRVPRSLTQRDRNGT